MSEQPLVAEFKVHDLWLSPRDFYYRVVEVGVTGQAVLRMGQLGTGRKVFKSAPKKGWNLVYRQGAE